MKNKILQWITNRFSGSIEGGQMIHADSFAPTATAQVGSGAVVDKPIRVAEPVERLGAPLQSLLAYTIEWDYRWAINRGMLTRPTWALNQALTVSPMLADKVRFWCSAISCLDYTIKIRPNAKDVDRAKKQKDILEAAYVRQDMKSILDHLAKAKFYGFSILIKRQQIEPLNWWNFLRNGLYGEWLWNGDLKITNSVGLDKSAKLNPSAYIIRVCEDNMLLEMLSAYVQIRETSKWWNRNMEQESHRQIIIVAGEGIANVDDYKSASRLISEGKSGWIEGGIGDHRTEVLFPPASRGLPYYENSLKFTDELLTKALTGGMLNNLTRSGGGMLGKTHQETLQMIVAAEAKDISNVLREQYDAPLLRDAGLLNDGETADAYFELATGEQVDTTKIADQLSKLFAAGLRAKEDALDKLSDEFGFDLEYIPADEMGGSGGGSGAFGKTVQAGPKRPVGGRQQLSNRADHAEAGKILARARRELSAATQADLRPVALCLNTLYANAEKLTPEKVKEFCQDTLPAMMKNHGATDGSIKAWQAFLSESIAEGLTGKGAEDAESVVANRENLPAMPDEVRVEIEALFNRASALRDAALRGESMARNSRRAERLEKQAQCLEAQYKA